MEELTATMTRLQCLWKLYKDAVKNLERVQATYKDYPDILAIYEPSARYLVSNLEQTIDDLFRKEHCD